MSAAERTAAGSDRPAPGATDHGRAVATPSGPAGDVPRGGWWRFLR